MQDIYVHVHTQITGWPFFCQKVWRLLSHLQRKVACLFDVGTYPYSLNAIHDGFREAMASASEPGQAHQTWLRPIPFKKTLSHTDHTLVSGHTPLLLPR